VPEHPKTTPTPVTLPPFVERDDRCSMTGRMFRTFDGTEYSYDVCHHVMMRDMLNDLWSVSGMSKTKQNNYLKTIERKYFFSCSVHDHCPATEAGCSRLLRIDHNKEIIELLPGLKVGYKGFEYSILQVRLTVVCHYDSVNISIFIRRNRLRLCHLISASIELETLSYSVQKLIVSGLSGTFIPTSKLG
jgi:hypothetical protein